VSRRIVDYDDIQQLKPELGRTAETLIALSPDNDPFYVRPYRRRAAEWIARMCADLPRPAHCRRIHYFLLSAKDGTKMADGSPYLNSEKCWQALCHAIRDAVSLGLVPADAIVDQRNDPPVVYLVEAEDGEIWIDKEINFFTVTPSLPNIQLQPPVLAPPYHVEVWVEKSTMNDILLPLAQLYGVNLVSGVGEESATACRALVERAMRSELPVRILYISDLDPGGVSVPLAVARKIEHDLARRGLVELDIQLRPIALTREQCVYYKLPRIPVKDQKRKGRFEERFGEGATELDALEALKPGELSKIVTREIERYHDPDQKDRIEEAEQRLWGEIAEVERDIYGRHKEAVDELLQEWKALSEKMEPLWREIADDLEADLPEIDMPESEFVGDEHPDPLFDSRRDYLTQIDRYKAHQGKRTEGYSIVATCKTCRNEFTATRPDAAYCSAECRVKRDRSAERRAERDRRSRDVD
jgi:hypothetical protein